MVIQVQAEQSSTSSIILGAGQREMEGSIGPEPLGQACRQGGLGIYRGVSCT